MPISVRRFTRAHSPREQDVAKREAADAALLHAKRLIIF
jgi:hypothetical protein